MLSATLQSHGLTQLTLTQLNDSDTETASIDRTIYNVNCSPEDTFPTNEDLKTSLPVTTAVMKLPFPMTPITVLAQNISAADDPLGDNPPNDTLLSKDNNALFGNGTNTSLIETETFSMNSSVLGSLSMSWIKDETDNGTVSDNVPMNQSYPQKKKKNKKKKSRFYLYYIKVIFIVYIFYYGC